MRIARVFPRRTRATPIDHLAFIGDPGLFPPNGIDEVHVSVTFSWDLPEGKRLVKAWRKVAPTKIGGPATGMPGGEFTPGMYVKPGLVITSRGCPNRCWFCDVWKREGDIRELKVRDGYHVLDDNLIACSRGHVERVFDMLGRQAERPMLNGGIESKLLQSWMAERLWALHPESIFFAHDPGDSIEDFARAAGILRDAGFKLNNQRERCYVLIGYKGDTLDQAEDRLLAAWDLGFLPMAMLYRGNYGREDPQWKKFKSVWANPSRTRAVVKQISGAGECPDECAHGGPDNCHGCMD